MFSEAAVASDSHTLVHGGKEARSGTGFRCTPVQPGQATVAHICAPKIREVLSVIEVPCGWMGARSARLVCGWDGPWTGVLWAVHSLTVRQHLKPLQRLVSRAASPEAGLAHQVTKHLILAPPSVTLHTDQHGDAPYADP